MNRTDIINGLIKKRGYLSYLEIGTHYGGMFDLIECEHKVGVEPVNAPHRDDIYQGTSDQFFEENTESFDIIFIDGLHRWEQVLRDAGNALEILSPGGVIVLHDCNPAERAHQTRSAAQDGVIWNGDVWKALIILRAVQPFIKVCVVDTDFGCGIIEETEYLEPLLDGGELDLLDFDVFNRHRQKALNLISVEEFKTKFL